MRNKKNEWYIVRVGTKEDYERIIELCLERGYENVSGLGSDSFPVFLNVIVINDGTKQFGLTNVTCMAAAASQGKRAIGTEEYLRKMKNDC